MTITTMTNFRTCRTSRWDQVKLRIAEWQHRSRSRSELDTLSDATLRDIGLSRCDVHREINKPFWMA